MNNYSSYGPRRRAIEERKKKRKNRLINGAIALVLIGIVFVSGMLIFGGDEKDVAVDSSGNEQLDENNERNYEQTDPMSDNNENDVNSGNARSNETESDVPQNRESEIELNDNESENEANIDDRTTPPRDGEWEPISTVQEEPFVAVYDKNHVNWQEMTRALQYATGIGDDIVIWWLGNGGDHQSAEGYVSDSVNQDRPYKVRLEWVPNRGWKPVSVEQLNENPYR